MSLREIDRDNADRNALHLVEGGRWLLASYYGSVTVYDLDDPHDKGKAIIQRHDEVLDNQKTTSLDVDMLAQTSTLSFNLAIVQDLRGV